MGSIRWHPLGTMADRSPSDSQQQWSLRRADGTEKVFAISISRSEQTASAETASDYSAIGIRARDENSEP